MNIKAKIQKNKLKKKMHNTNRLDEMKERKKQVKCMNLQKHAKAQQREKGYTEIQRIFINFDSIAHN